MSAQAAKTTLLVGIDFGTTFSGVSWLLHKDGTESGKPEVIDIWPALLARDSSQVKVPSKLYYDPESKDVVFGYNIPADAQPIEWFKLLLLEPEDLQDHVRDSTHIKLAKLRMQELGKSPVDLVGDYLKALWDHCINEIEDENGDYLIRATPIHVILTVPAIWKGYARQRMQEAATKAGILGHRPAGNTTLSFISEPEAATLATLSELDIRQDFSTGDTFVVLDAGGGTVDIISYKVEKTEPLVVSECVEGDGALCGATFLDEEFENFMKVRLGAQVWAVMDQEAIKKMMSSEWEHGIKAEFNGKKPVYTIDVPKRGTRSQEKITSTEIRKIFDSVMPQIRTLLGNQIDGVIQKTSRSPKFVILVGGFGRCPYLFEDLKKSFSGRVSVLKARGEKPWSAVCRGATLSGIAGRGITSKPDVQIQSRVARLSYGMRLCPPFQEGLHDPRDKVFDHVDGSWRADSQMMWFVKRGQVMSALQPEEYAYGYQWPIYERGHRGSSMPIYTSHDQYPTSRYDSTVSASCTLEYRTPRPVEHMDKHHSNGMDFLRWDLKYKVIASGAVIDVTIVDTKTGKNLTSENIAVQFE
ncbi:hypothetical protein GGR57DRAFT_498034 [Xylariaceae sp. FL1272]|nr:hypothetical protein GGR57DRAFT_498034 [Xylariaceae sp. FL1272]